VAALATDQGRQQRIGRKQVARTTASVVRVFLTPRRGGQICTRGSEGILTRVTIKPQRYFCSPAVVPPHSLKVRCQWWGKKIQAVR
jgi:hypothetical protein